MNPEETKLSGDPFAYYRRAVRPLAPYATIWGVQWALNAFLQYIWIWPYQDLVWPATAVAALLLTLIAGLKDAARGSSRTPSLFMIVWAALLIAMSVGSLELLKYVQAIDPFFMSVLHACLLSISYVAAGKWLGRPFIYLGLWLFALTVIVSLWYLGFTSTVTGFFGGLSLIASGWMIRRWN